MAKALLYSLGLSLILLVTYRPFTRFWNWAIAFFSRPTSSGISSGDALEEAISARAAPIQKTHARLFRLRQWAEMLLIPGLSFFLIGGILRETTIALLGAAMWALSLASTSLLRGADAMATGVAYSGRLLAPVNRRDVVYDDQARRRGFWFLLTGLLFFVVLVCGVVTVISLGS